VLCDLVWDVSRPSGNVAALYDLRTYARGAVSLDSCAHERALPLVVSVNLIEVGEHLLGRAVDFDAVLDHGSILSSRRPALSLLRDHTPTHRS